MAKVSGSAAPKHEDWESLTIRKAGNGGFIVEKQLPFKPSKGNSSGLCSYTPPPAPLVFENAQTADAYIDACMGVKEEGVAEEKAEKGKKGY